MKNRTAIIHDWLNGMRGGEKVLEVLLDIFPEADIFTLFLEEDNISDKIKEHKIFTSSLNRYNFIRKRYQKFLPFFPAAIEEFNLNDYDLVISSSHCVAKGIIPFPGTLHLSYIHSPMRYIWDRYYSYFGRTHGLKKFIIKQQMNKLRSWDVSSSTRVDYFIANSTFIQERIRRYYRREAVVVHPPVDIDYFKPLPDPSRNFYLTVSALVPYKEVDVLIQAFNQLDDQLIIVGKGPEEKRLRRMAGENIQFRQGVDVKELSDLYGNAAAFVFAGIEDFGIAFVEAQACGTPVIAYRKGGILDIVNEQTGVFFDKQTPESIIEAILKQKKSALEPSIIRENSIKFSPGNFKKNFLKFYQKVKKIDD